MPEKRIFRKVKFTFLKRIRKKQNYHKNYINMARKARLTVFSRFIIMMLIVGPLAFLGASYYNGENGVETIKDVFNQGSKESTKETRTNRTEPSATDADENATYKIRKLEEELEYKQKRLDEMHKENEALKQKVDELERQVAGE